MYWQKLPKKLSTDNSHEFSIREFILYIRGYIFPMLNEIVSVDGNFIESDYKSESAIRISKAIMSLFIKENSFDFTVKQLSEYSGVSERTFHRYFPRKEDVVRPAMALGADRLSRMVADRPATETLTVALKSAFALSWWATHPAESIRFRKLMHEADFMRAVWVDIITQAEDGMTRAIAARLDEGRRSRAPLIASVVYAAIRRSIDGYDMHSNACLARAFAANLDAIAEGLFPNTTPKGGFQ